MKYVELDKHTLEIFSGPFECLELPDAESMHTIPVEVDDSVTEVFRGQHYNKETKIFEDTPRSINLRCLQYLKDTDWYEIRSINGKAIPDDILAKRQECRDLITNNQEVF